MPAVHREFTASAALELERRFEAGPLIRSRVVVTVGIGDVGELVVPDVRAELSWERSSGRT